MRTIPTLCRPATLRALEGAARARLPAGTLMRRAGEAAAGHAQRLAGAPCRVLVLAGPGDNGGDGAVCAAVLARRGFAVWLAQAAPSRPGIDAEGALAACPDTVARIDDPRAAPAPALVIDALFGIGLARPVGAPWDEWIGWANALPARRLPLDVPSGLDAARGAVLRAVDGRGACFVAHETITFLADKPGLHTGEGPDHAGRVRVEALGIDDLGVDDPGVDAASADPAGATARDGVLSSPAAFASALAALRRARSAHKGNFGMLAVIGGAPGMAGALLLTARAALAAGAGRVRAGFVGGPPIPVDPVNPEAMLADATSALAQGPTTAVLGPGLSRTPAARDALAAAIGLDIPLVLDADALNLIAADPALREACTARRAPSLLTPHPLEAARLLGTTVAEVSADRVEAALRIASGLNASVVLKGAGSVVAAPVGRWWINPTGGPALATGGTGDVLAGLAGALVAQTMQAADPTEALLAAVWVHGAAGDAAAADAGGDVGVVAGELPAQARRVLNRLVAEHVA